MSSSIKSLRNVPSATATVLVMEPVGLALGARYEHRDRRAGFHRRRALQPTRSRSFTRSGPAPALTATPSSISSSKDSFPRRPTRPLRRSPSAGPAANSSSSSASEQFHICLVGGCQDAPSRFSSHTDVLHVVAVDFSMVKSIYSLSCSGFRGQRQDTTRSGPGLIRVLLRVFKDLIPPGTSGRTLPTSYNRTAPCSLQGVVLSQRSW